MKSRLQPVWVALSVTLVASFAAGARDLLRPGVSQGSGPAGTSQTYGATGASTAQATANASDVLARTTQALQAVQAMQNAARNAALKAQNNLGADPNHPGQQLPNVPNGLAAGGLVPDTGLASNGVANPTITWQGAGTPVQSTKNGNTTVSVPQTSQQAILNWQTFNIGQATTLDIDQSAGGANVGQWVAFNKINDPTGIPSQILGSIHALGQVYLINQNGIIFGGASQVNVHTLVASSLPINDNLIGLGLLNNADEQFLFSQIPINPGANGTPAFTPPAPNTPSGRDGDVVVQQGASISAPTTADHVGGRVALIGPNVTNAGTISTPDGQTILAAGNQVAMTGHATTDPSLRGLNVYVGAVDQYSGNATNSGLIDVPRGNISMTGKSVNQLGVADSTTSVSLNGRIDLLADYGATSSGGVQNVQPFLPQFAGSVTLGQGSVTEITPELDSTERVVGSQLALSSLVNIQGQTIHLAQDSILLAPGARTPADASRPALGIDGLGLNSGITLNAGVWTLASTGAISVYNFVHSAGQIYLDAGAMINAAGTTNVSAPVSENIVSAQLRGAELQNSPLQRNGILRGQTVHVDIRQTGIYNGNAWVGTPLADVSGYASLVDHTVAELTTDGGTISLTAGNSVVMQRGSTVNVSGGWINYQGAMVQTTKLISGGHIYDISQATPDIVYQGILNGFTADYSKWGITETFGTPLIGGPYFQKGYIEGGNGGSIRITAPSTALDGNLLGNTVSGPRQRAIAPALSVLSLVFQAQDPVPPAFVTTSPTPPDIIFESGVTLAAADPFAVDGLGNPLPLRADREAEVVLSPDLTSKNGFGVLNINNSDGNITVPANVSLTTAVGGAVSFAAANINIQGRITASSGALSFSTYDISPYLALTSTPPADPARGQFTLGGAASLSTAGLVVNDLASSSSPYSLSLVNSTNGGSVSINSYNVRLAGGSAIDVSGGVALSENTKGAVVTSFGKGGSLTINAGQDPSLPSLLGGKLVLGATLKGYSGGKGGTLSLLAPLIQIGGSATTADTLLLSPDFFNQGGFASFNLSGIGAATGQAFQYIPAIDIAPGTVIAPQVKSYVAAPDLTGINGVVLTPVLAPEGVRTAVSLTFKAIGATDQFNTITPLLARGDFVMGKGAIILTDPQTDPTRGVTISGQSVTVLGSIIVPGGVISIKGAADTSILFANNGESVPTVDLGPQSILSTAGRIVLTPDPTGQGLRTGSVLPGGNITVSGNIVAEAGALLDVSGATGTLDLPPADSGQDTPLNGSFHGRVAISTRVDSNGGSITLAGGTELFTDATLRGAAGGPSAVGGSLTLSSGINGTGGQTPLNPNLLITQNQPTISVPFYPAGQTAIGHAVLDIHGNIISGMGYFAADSFNTSGLASLTLKDTVQFSGPVNISAASSLTIATGGVIFADSAVTLSAPYVAMGTPFQTPLQTLQLPVSVFQLGSSPFYFPPTFGTGSLTVNANLIDIGNLSLQNIGKANFNALNGDIRGGGTLDVAGDINMAASQVYPPTDVTFTIAAYDHGGIAGTVTIQGSGVRQLPLSAGGVLNVYGSIINQGGVLRAPLGTINLGWDGTGSVPVDLITGSGLEDTNGNPVATATIATTQQVTLSKGSVTSVSAIDPTTGKGVLIPYGIELNGTQWIDPTGTDITKSGPPGKVINISAVNVADNAGAVIDIRGGGDLYAYRWVGGLGGTTDILASSSGFAIVPGYNSSYAPYAPYNPSPLSGNLSDDAGYVNSSLKAGDRIYLSGGNGLAAGFYTLLPARYALLPGGLLVTPLKSQVAPVAVTNPDGSTVMPGYRVATGQGGQPLYTAFEVDSQSVVQSRAEYDNFYANNNFLQGALATNAAVPRLPVDAGQLVLAATQAMAIQGVFYSKAPAGGRGGLVDISSPVDILINSTGVDNTFNGLVLNAANLSSIGAESLLIGGVRHTGVDGTDVTVTTNNVTVNNQGTPLAGSDVILVANDNLTLAPGAEVTATGALSNAETLQFGNSSTPGSGNGTLLRVSGDAAAQITRSGVSASTSQFMVIGAGAQIKGASITLDSTYATSLDPAAIPAGQTVNLNSGQISIQLDNPGSVPQIPGLMLSGLALQTLQSSAHALSLLSYSSIDIYGTGQVGGNPDASGLFPVASLALHTAEIRGFNNDGGTVTFAAQNILLDNIPAGTVPVRALPSTPAAGTALVFNAGVIRLGASQLDLDQYSMELSAMAGSQPSNSQFNLNQYIDQYAQVTLNASGGVLAQGTIKSPKQQSLQGSIVTDVLNTQGDLTISTPLIAGVTGALQTIAASGAMSVTTPAGNPSATVSGGLGASFTLQGSTVAVNSSIVLPSGMLTLHATAGDVQIGNISAGSLDVSGVAQNFFDLVKYTDGGRINLVSDTGNVNVGASGVVNVSAQQGGGNAGTLSVSARAGSLVVDPNASLLGHGGAGGQNGMFSLDVGTIPGGALGALATVLDAGGFTHSISIRDRNDSTLVVDGVTKADSFNLSSDSGSITVTGTIDASGLTGGTINLVAHNNLILQAGAELTVVGDYYSDAGKGGAITLEAGAETNGSLSVATKNGSTFSGNGYMDIQAGSGIDLGVTHQLTTSDLFLGNTTDNRTDLFMGTLHLRAPRTAAGTDLQINPINGTISNASSIVVEGYKIYTSGGAITTTIENTILSNGNTFAGAKGTTTANYTTMQNRLFSGNADSIALKSISLIEPGAEIINMAGDLTLAANWDLSTYRFGPLSEAGDLTLRAAGNLVFNFKASLSDGFGGTSSFGLWNRLMLAAGSQSWSYRLVSGADFSAANFRAVQPLANLASNKGSLLLGQGSPALSTSFVGIRSSVIPNFYQTIRTGVGSIDIYAGRDVQLLNPIATIYTAGSQAAAMANFDLPNLSYSNSAVGTPQTPVYRAQYSLGGGNITISAQNDIASYIGVGSTLKASSSKELPDNWLYRQGWIDPTTGQFGQTQSGGNVASTSWWVDFSNFFDGIGALGGGNVTMTAGHNITNVDAAVPTNARMPKGTPDASAMLELGGGDLLVNAGNSISGGVYYVERGQGILDAGGKITTNSTRAALTQNEISSDQNLGITPDPTTWLPTALFLGKGSFDISAGGDLQLGPVVNTFLLPQGINNSFLEKTYFSTYSTSDFVDVSSLAGDVTIKNGADGGTGSLASWFQNVDITFQNPNSFAAISQPWLGLVETSIPSSTALAIMPPALRATAFSGDINLVGTLILSPSPRGTVDLAAAGSINGVQPNGLNTFDHNALWASSLINLSDADPNRVPGITTPASYRAPSTDPTVSWTLTDESILAQHIDILFNESGSTEGNFGVIQTRQALHAPGVLHLNDPDPIHLYAGTGDISGLTLFSGKFARVVAGQDITDVALYLTNDNAGDVSVVSAGRDVIPYAPDSLLRTTAQMGNNELFAFTNGITQPASGSPTAGDIQISGPGTLEVLAGRSLNLGIGPNNEDGTAVGITSIGNAANPYLPFGGAGVIAGAGIGDSSGLANSRLDFASFIAQFLNPSTGGEEAKRYLPDLGAKLGLGGGSDTQIWDAFSQLTPSQQDVYALDIFYLALRDAGRDHNDSSSPGFGNYTAGYAAIDALFPGKAWSGDITLTSREIKTQSGGDINIFAPGGQLTVGLPVAGTQAVDQGILTEDGGDIFIFTRNNVNVGTSRIFTLRGGDEVIWSSLGNIAAGASSKTVQSAPPTRVLIDPQSGNVQTDLAGLATGGGIGVLATVVGVPVGNVDLIAPSGTVDAGDAGIRATGNLNISAVQVLNAGNIQVGGASSGTPAAPSAPNVSGLTAASNTAAAGNSAANDVARQQTGDQNGQQDVPSIITVEVLGYGGGDNTDQTRNDDTHKKSPPVLESAILPVNPHRAVAYDR